MQEKCIFRSQFYTNIRFLLLYDIICLPSLWSSVCTQWFPCDNFWFSWTILIFTLRSLEQNKGWKWFRSVISMSVSMQGTQKCKICVSVFLQGEFIFHLILSFSVMNSVGNFLLEKYIALLCIYYHFVRKSHKEGGGGGEFQVLKK